MPVSNVSDYQLGCQWHLQGFCIPLMYLTYYMKKINAFQILAMPLKSHVWLLVCLLLCSQACLHCCYDGSPQVLFFEKAEVAVVDVEDKVIDVAVEGDDLPLGVGSHALEQDALVVLYALRSILFLSLPAELHLVVRRDITRSVFT